MFCRFRDWRLASTLFDRNVKNLDGSYRHRSLYHMMNLMSLTLSQSSLDYLAYRG